MDCRPAKAPFSSAPFWLANSLALIGRQEDAVALFERLLTLRNDLGLLAEEYDPRAKRFLGNFPQAFSHIGVVNTAAHLARVEAASADRGADKTPNPKPGASQGSSATGHRGVVYASEACNFK